MSEPTVIAIVAIFAALISGIAPLIFQAYQASLTRKQWFAEFAIKRQYEIVHNLHSVVILSQYERAKVGAIAANELNPPPFTFEQYAEGNFRLEQAHSMASIYLDDPSNELLKSFYANLARIGNLAARIGQFPVADRMPFHQEITKLIDETNTQVATIGEALKPFLNPPAVRSFVARLDK